MVVVIDTREQNPVPITKAKVKRMKLWPGDYSIPAYSRMFAIERKSVSDLIGTMRTGYAGYNSTSPKRFDCELLGLGGVLHLGGDAFILVEPDEGYHGDAQSQIATHSYRAMIPPMCISAFVRTIERGYGIPVKFADSREHAAQIIEYHAAAALVEKKSKSNIRKSMSMSTTTKESANV